MSQDHRKKETRDPAKSSKLFDTAFYQYRLFNTHIVSKSHVARWVISSETLYMASFVGFPHWGHAALSEKENFKYMDF